VKNVEEENLNKLLVNCLLKCVIQTFALLTKNPNRISILPGTRWVQGYTAFLFMVGSCTLLMGTKNA